MQFTFTFQFTLPCFRCGQLITTQDFQQGNCQLIFPEGIMQHKTCPLKPPCYLNQCHLNKPLNAY